MTRDEAIEELALRFAKQRTGGSVFMNGSHNPKPSEVLAARHFIDDLLYSGWSISG